MSATLSRAWLLSAAPATRRQARLGRWFRGWLVFRRNRLAVSGLLIVALLGLVAAAAPLLASEAATVTQVLADRLQPPSWAHLFGTDEIGRDIFARIVFGSRVTLGIVVMVAVIVVPIGLGIGLPAGYLGGWVDVALMRLTDMFLAFPRLILAFALARRPGAGHPQRHHRDRPDLLAALRAAGAGGDAVVAQKRVRGGRAAAGRVGRAHFVVAYRPALPAIGHHPPDAGHGRHRGDRGRAGVPGPGRAAAAAGMGRDGGDRASGAAGSVVGGDHPPAFAILVSSLAFNLLGDGLRDVFDPRSA